MHKMAFSFSTEQEWLELISHFIASYSSFAGTKLKVYMHSKNKSVKRKKKDSHISWLRRAAIVT